LAIVMAVGIVLGACSNDELSFPDLPAANPLAPASAEELAAAIDAFGPGQDQTHAQRSALDSLTESRQSELDDSETVLGALLPSPDGFGSFRLADLQLNDPNGDGRIDGNWYPPRVLREECSTKVDSPPGPAAEAIYVPGGGDLGDANPMAVLEAIGAALVVTVQVQVFDEAAQRDGFLQANNAFYRDPAFTCGGRETTVQSFLESEVGTDQLTAVVFELEEPLIGSGATAWAAVGDRVLLAVSVASNDPEAPWVAEDQERSLAAALQVSIDRLEMAELP